MDINRDAGPLYSGVLQGRRLGVSLELIAALLGSEESDVPG